MSTTMTRKGSSDTHVNSKAGGQPAAPYTTTNEDFLQLQHIHGKIALKVYHPDNVYFLHS